MKKFASFSITLHIILFSLVFMNFDIIHKTNRGNTQILHSYLYQMKPALNKKSFSKIDHLQKQSKTKKADTIKLENHNTEKITNETINASPNLISANNNSKDNISELAKKLHDLIQENISQANEIRDLMKNKNVEVSFLLYPEGKIENAQIIKSSGINIIDSIVLDAIQSIQPVKLAKDLLQNKEQFRINIIFS